MIRRNSSCAIMDFAVAVKFAIPTRRALHYTQNGPIFLPPDFSNKIASIWNRHIKFLSPGKDFHPIMDMFSMVLGFAICLPGRIIKS